MTTLDDFMERTVHLHYAPKAIFPSEMFLFYREALAADADLIIESGVGNGGSTSYLAALFPDLPIIAIDKGKVLEAREKLGKRIEFEQGNASEVLPVIVDEVYSKRIAILIDGPKGEAAVDLARQMLERANVAFVAVHDLHYDCPGQYRVQSHDLRFREDFAFLDFVKVPKEQVLKQPFGPGLSIFSTRSGIGGNA